MDKRSTIYSSTTIRHPCPQAPAQRQLLFELTLPTTQRRQTVDWGRAHWGTRVSSRCPVQSCCPSLGFRASLFLFLPQGPNRPHVRIGLAQVEVTLSDGFYRERKHPLD